MKRFNKHSYHYVGAVIVVALIVTISFQNCGKAGFDTGVEDTSVDLGSLSPTVASAPQAFDAAFDSISYMGCFGNGAVGKPGFYTISAGAFGTKGGIKVRTDFVDYALKNIRPIAPAREASTEQIKEFLSKTPANVSSMPQVAFRRINDLTSVQTNSNQATLGIDFINIIFDPTDDRIMDPMLRAPNTFVNYFPMAPSSSRKFEARLNFNNNELLARDVRYSLNLPESRLALTFAANNRTSAYRTPSSDTSKGFGRSYALKFSVPRFHYTYFPENILTEVTEVNLENGQATTDGFDCEKIRLKVYRPKDRAQCPAQSIAALSDPTIKSKLDVVRQHLKAEFWDVNISLKCAVPKDPGSDCYPTDQTDPVTRQPFDVAYNQDNPDPLFPPTPCFSQASNYPSDIAANPPKPWCPQYVSFCVKQ